MTQYNTLLLDLEENYYDMMAGSIPYWFLIFFVAMAIFVLVFRLLVVAFFQNEMIVLGLCLIHLVAELVLSAGPEKKRIFILRNRCYVIGDEMVSNLIFNFSIFLNATPLLWFNRIAQVID